MRALVREIGKSGDDVTLNRRGKHCAGSQLVSENYKTIWRRGARCALTSILGRAVEAGLRRGSVGGWSGK